jgi:protein-disulfide isomerase
MEAGTRLGVESTPTVSSMAGMVNGSHPYETFEAIINEEPARSHTARD